MKILSGGKKARCLLNQAAKTVVGGKDLHTSGVVQGTLTMPERLVEIPEAEVGNSGPYEVDTLGSLIFQDPGFFEMVEYFFHKACILAEDKLIDVDMKNVRTTRGEKVKKAHGILKIIEPCAHVLEVNFPLLRDDGTYEMINGYRAQHSHHRFEQHLCCLFAISNF